MVKIEMPHYIILFLHLPVGFTTLSNRLFHLLYMSKPPTTQMRCCDQKSSQMGCKVNVQ